jgi:hypothetical protein
MQASALAAMTRLRPQNLAMTSLTPFRRRAEGVA